MKKIKNSQSQTKFTGSYEKESVTLSFNTPTELPETGFLLK